MTSINKPLPSTAIQDNARKREYKNLIKEKILKPSKLPKYTSIRTHHSHLVIRDSHYLIKSPTSFITCASCHRGRVLKITSIQDATTEEILKEVYDTISKNPCSKRKQTPKELKDINASTDITNNGLHSSQLVNSLRTLPLQDHKFKSGLQFLSDEQSFKAHQLQQSQQLQHQHQNQNQNGQLPLPLPLPQYQQTHQLQQQQQQHPQFNHNPVPNPSTSSVSLNMSRYSSNGSLNPTPTILPHPSTSSSISTIATSATSSLIPNNKALTIDNFLSDFEESALPELDEKIEIKSTGSAMNITNYTLTALYNGHTSFPQYLDFFNSLAIDHDICKDFYQNDTLIVTLPTHANTLFFKDFNKEHLLKDEILAHTIHTRIQNFVAQPDLKLDSFKIVIIFNYFQEGIPERPHENQSFKYVGNVHVIHAFNVLEDSSLSYTNSRYSFNHNYTWVEPKEETIKTEIFNELIIKKVQSEIFLKYQQDLLGSHINYNVSETGSTLTTINYVVDDSFNVTATSSLFVVSFMTLKVLRVLAGEDGLNMISYLADMKVDTRHNVHILKLLLDKLQEHQRVMLPIQTGL